ncbi:MAG: 2-C-methyl-D-erythritol 4-phosphate cytidylyltransferase [Clostridiales bacterium]|nr:2-C-methyl-D-erythritol 4-phosphate cytidylyltransferase [Clostridiales bacterium]
MKYPIIGIILAAAKGLRMGGSVPKQYHELAGRPILAHSLEAFDRAPSIDAIVIVSADKKTIKEDILQRWPISKPVNFVLGGSERQDSVWNALNAIESCKIVVIHDGVRPLIEVPVIEESIRVAQEFGAAIAGMPSKDTIKIVDDKGFSIKTPDRNTLWAIQTPQTFKFNLLKEAHIKAKQDVYIGTDDSSLLERINYPVKLIEGGYDNIKITTPEDLIIASEILKFRGK